MKVFKQPDNSVAEILNLLATQIDKRAKQFAARHSDKETDKLTRAVLKQIGFHPMDFGKDFFKEFQETSESRNLEWFRQCMIVSLVDIAERMAAKRLKDW